MKRIYFVVEDKIFVLINNLLMDTFYVRRVDVETSNEKIFNYGEKIFSGYMPQINNVSYELAEITKKEEINSIISLVQEVLQFKYNDCEKMTIKVFDSWAEAYTEMLKNTTSLENKGDKPTLNEVILPKETKDKLYQIVRLLNNNEKYAKIGAKVEKGMLLTGKPGTGKSRAMECLANEIDAEFILKCGSEFSNKYVGVGSDNVRKLFEEARKFKKVIIFIDEIDAVGGKRGDDNNKERDTTLNQLLVEISKIKPSENIFVVGATNHKELLDEAITRSGRLSLHLEIEMPNEKCRKEIFKLYMNNLVHEEEMDYNKFANLTEGLCGADIEFICNQAAINTVDDDRDIVTMNDILNQIKYFKRSRNIKEKKEKKIGFGI